jgi:hypothetical protein
VLVLPSFAVDAPPFEVWCDDAPPFEVWCDASGFGLGGILLQNKRVVLYDSRALTPAERNYGVGEQELLAVVHALKVWRCYLEGCPNDVIVCTDHSPNTYLPIKANLSHSVVCSHILSATAEVLPK